MSYKNYFFLGVLLLVLIIYFYLKFIEYVNKQTYKENQNNFLEKKKLDIKNSDIINVKIDDCEIISRSYLYNKEKFNLLKYQIQYVLMPYQKRSIAVNDSYSLIKAKAFYKGKKRIFISEQFSLDVVNTKIKILLNEKITIYVDKLDENSYFFDLNFLNDENK